MRPTWKKSRTPSALVHLRTRFWSRRLRASATPSALRWSGWAPNGSSMELDWSSRNTRAVGLARLIGAVYGMVNDFPDKGEQKRSAGHDAAPVVATAPARTFRARAISDTDTAVLAGGLSVSMSVHDKSREKREGFMYSIGWKKAPGAKATG